jgi:hypothetical protein
MGKGSNYLAALRVNGNGHTANGNGHAVIGKKGRPLMESTVVSLRSHERLNALAVLKAPAGWIRGQRDGEFIRIADWTRLIIAGDLANGQETRCRVLRVEITTPTGVRLVLLGDPALELLSACSIPVPDLNLTVPKRRYVDSVDED